jgi:hypothetical protein
MRKMRTNLLVLFMAALFTACTSSPPPQTEQWTTHEFVLQSSEEYLRPYTEVSVSVLFTNQAGVEIKRPAFWDGDNHWKVRFASPDDSSLWRWESSCSDRMNPGLHAQKGAVQAVPYTGKNDLLRHGLLKMSPGKRNVVHADGKTFLVVGDTPWAIPFRATVEQVKKYARDRQEKGFNTALLMSLQPDMKAEGPNARNTDQGFARAFADLPDGHINDLQPEYFQYLDSLMAVLIEHEIVPVYQPVFHGFGWKGLDVLGNHIEPAEYVRYCQYLLARYGAQPAMWLLAGDNGGRDPGVKESGEMMEEWDCYQQPTGLHYNPCDDYVADWAVNNPFKHCEHYNKTFQAEPWLDFQWAQTGHNGEHLLHKVERMYDNLPTKAAANGEPTYEGMNDGQNGLGWWQGEESWLQLMSGGTMGVVYGAAGLWQWKVSADEAGWTAWASQAKSWEGALEMEGSRYVGNLGKALGELDLADIEKRPDLLEKGQYLLAREGEMYLSYLPQGGEIVFKTLPGEVEMRWFHPRTGEFVAEPVKVSQRRFEAPDRGPWVLVLEKSQSRKM